MEQEGMAQVQEEQQQVLPRVRLVALPKLGGALEGVDPRVALKRLVSHELGVGRLLRGLACLGCCVCGCYLGEPCTPGRLVLAYPCLAFGGCILGEPCTPGLFALACPSSKLFTLGRLALASSRSCLFVSLQCLLFLICFHSFRSFSGCTCELWSPAPGKAASREKASAFENSPALSKMLPSSCTGLPLKRVCMQMLETPVASLADRAACRFSATNFSTQSTAYAPVPTLTMTCLQEHAAAAQAALAWCNDAKVTRRLPDQLDAGASPMKDSGRLVTMLTTTIWQTAAAA
jgi:hypothetical protein